MFWERVQVAGVEPWGHEKLAIRGQAICRHVSTYMQAIWHNAYEIDEQLAEGPPDGEDGQ